jgi:hypothetical protein
METDTLRTWGVKNVPDRIIKTITDSAKKEGLTIAQWLERRIEEWVEGGSPVRLNPVLPRADYIQAIAALNHSIAELSRAPDTPLVKTAAISSRRLLLADRRRNLIAAPSSQPAIPEAQP